MKILGYVLFLLALAPAVDAASFDCTKANTLIEKAICSDESLSSLDERLHATYQKVMSATPIEFQPVKLEQRAWLKNIRNSCQDEVCLKDAYTARITVLEGQLLNSKQTDSIVDHDIDLGHAENYDENKLWELGKNIRVSPDEEDAPDEHICVNRVDVEVDCSSSAAYDRKTIYTPYVTRYLRILNKNDFPITCSGSLDEDHLDRSDFEFQGEIAGGETMLFTYEKDYDQRAGRRYPEVICSFEYNGKKFIERMVMHVVNHEEIRSISYDTLCLKNYPNSRRNYDCEKFK